MKSIHSLFFHLFDKINISRPYFPAQTNTYDLKYLLKLATKIQKRIKIEHDADIKNSLKNDLKIVKSQIGNQVLEMPEDQIVFPPVKITHYSASNSPVQKIPVKRVPSSSKSVILEFSDDDLVAKFDSFLEQRKKTHKIKSKTNNAKNTKSTKSHKTKRAKKKGNF